VRFVTEYLWVTGGKYHEIVVPYVERLRLCELYHCTPSQLEDEDYHEAMIHLAIRSAEQRFDAATARALAARPPKA
jgi:hypothetical protein